MGEDRQDWSGRSSGQRASVREAAELLGTTVDAIRKRVQRGTIPYEKASDGRVWIVLDPVQDSAGHRQDTDRPQSDSAALISAKDETIAALRDQLEAERQAHAEARRLLMAALERIPPQIEAPQEAQKSPQTFEEEPQRAEPHTATEGAQGGTEHPQQRSGWLAPVEKLPWWQYLLGLFLVTLVSYLSLVVSGMLLGDATLSPLGYLLIEWLPPGVFGVWVGFRRRNLRFRSQIIPFGILVGLAIALGSVVSLVQEYGSMAHAMAYAAFVEIAALFTVFTVPAGWLFYVSGALIGNAWQRRRTGRLSGTIQASPVSRATSASAEPTTGWTPRKQALLGFAGTVIAALISLFASVMTAVMAGGG